MKKDPYNTMVTDLTDTEVETLTEPDIQRLTQDLAARLGNTLVQAPEQEPEDPQARLLAIVADAPWKRTPITTLPESPGVMHVQDSKPAAAMRDLLDGIDADREFEAIRDALLEQEADAWPEEPEPSEDINKDQEDKDGKRHMTTGDEEEPEVRETAEGGRNAKKGPSQASQLVEIARDRYELFMSEDGRPYGVRKTGANIALPLRGKAGLRSQLAKIYTDENRSSVPSQSALADAMTVLEGVAQGADPRIPHLRVARHEGSIVIDLGTPDGRCVVVGSDGWKAESRSPVLFRRSGAMKALPDPIKAGDGLVKLRDMLNMADKDFRLLVAWLVASFIPDLPHPILTFRGEQGTGKSYSAKMVIGLIDPSGAPQRTAPRDIKSWATQAFNSWALCLDNVSMIPDWLSDALCRAVTGDGIVDRALYTDDDVVVLAFRRVLALTTIDAGALAGDLAERLLTLELRVIPDDKRREEIELDQAYADAHASILASLFDLLSDVLKALPDVKLTERPRMADFARVLAAVDRVKKWKTFETYMAASRAAVADVLESDPFGEAVVKLVRNAGPNGVTYTAKEILEKVETPEKLPKGWPKDPTRAGGKLKRLAPVLRAVGISYDDSERQTDGNRSYLYAMRDTRETGSEGRDKTAPGTPAAPETGADLVERPGAIAGAVEEPAQYSTRNSDGAGATGASAGAVIRVAPAQETSSGMGKYTRTGATGATGAPIRLLSEDACNFCGKRLDPTDSEGGFHNECLEEVERSMAA